MKGMTISKLFAAAFAAAFFAGGGGFVEELLAVQPPSVESRQKAEAGHEKQKREIGAEIRKSGCPHGKDKKTGRCYEPREGQFYQDSEGNVHVKGVECVNLPWKPCGGKKAAPADKDKGKGGKKSK